MHEHNKEPVPGLPQELPEGERILWQGRSEFSSLAVSTLHVRKLAAYFAALLALRVIFKLNEGVALTDAVAGSTGLAVLAGAAIALLTYYARAASRASMFTITDRRIVLRCGVAVSVTINLPYTIIDSAELRLHKDGSGDISIRTDRTSRASYILLWPMVKPFRWMNVRPVLRGIKNAESVAATLAQALGEFELAAQQSKLETTTPSEAEEPRSRPKGRRWSVHPPLAGAASLVVFAIVAVSAFQLSERGSEATSLEPAIESVDLWFDDQDDGSVAVIDASNGLLIDTLEPGTNGFVRGALRSLARERRANDIGEEVPFSIRRTASGRVLLYDPATERVIDLRAFGPTNRGAFERFLDTTTNDPMAETVPPDADAAETGVAAVALTQQETKK
ncbi:MAG: photosynthetic complex putative assembly protein PuhB [Woeseiaceae bacterium]|nr:photosynthetic complex putative assembly protein PuhB [Woeseiaceae bacterium]